MDTEGIKAEAHRLLADAQRAVMAGDQVVRLDDAVQTALHCARVAHSVALQRRIALERQYDTVTIAAATLLTRRKYITQEIIDHASTIALQLSESIANEITRRTYGEEGEENQGEREEKTARPSVTASARGVQRRDV